LPVDQACELVRQAALGLQHAHEKGLVHRDIKPANLLLTKAGQVKVMDLGLSRMQEKAAQTLDATLTQTGSVVGTPDYMAPSRRATRTPSTSAATCTARLHPVPPADRHRALPGGTTMEKVFKQQLEEPTPVEHVRPEVPPALAAVVRRLMAKRPEDRCQTPAATAAALAPFCRATSAAADAAAEALTEVLPGNQPDLRRPSSSATTAAGSASSPRQPAPGRGKRPLVFAGLALLLLAGVVLVPWLLSGPTPRRMAPRLRSRSSSRTGRRRRSATSVRGSTPSRGRAGWRRRSATSAGGPGRGLAPWRGAPMVAGWPAGAWTPPCACGTPKTGQEHTSLRGHTKVLFRLAFSPDGKRLAAAGAR